MREEPLLKERIARELRERIVRMQTDAYVKIPSERSLSEALGISRISVRAAIKALAEEGWLVQEQGRGTFIPPRRGIRSLSILCAPGIKQTDPFYNEFWVQMTNTAALRAIGLRVIDPERLPDEAQSDPLLVVGQLADGVLERAAQAYGRIATLLGETEEPAAGATAVLFDDERIGRTAADLLAERGHRRLAMLAGPEKYRSARLRLKGFAERAAENGARLVIRPAKMNWQGGYESGDGIAELLRAEAEAPTALFAANDWMAAGLIQRLKEHGLRLPQQLSVVGCDDIPLAAQFRPALATFRLDMQEMIERTLAVLSDAEAADDPSPSAAAADGLPPNAPAADGGPRDDASGPAERQAHGPRTIRLSAAFVPRDSLAPYHS